MAYYASDAFFNRGHISALPVEILSMIFSLSLPTTHDYSRRRRFPIGNWTPFNLTRVCRRWREIALSEARLWTVLYLGARPGNSSECYRLTQIMQLWEERSKGLPLTISLDLENEGMKDRRLLHTIGFGRIIENHEKAWNSLEGCLSKLFAHCHRLEIGQSSSANVMRLAEFSQSILELVMLEASSEILRRSPDVRPGQWFLRLRTFEVHCTAHLDDSRFINTIKASSSSARQNLLKLTMRPRLPLDLVRLLLKNFPSLQTFEVVIPLWTGRDGATQITSHIRRLFITVSADFAGSINPYFLRGLGTLSFPALQALRLSFIDERSSLFAAEIMEIMASILHQSKCPLTTLCLNLPSREHVDVGVLLRELPTLRSLHVFETNPTIVNDVVDALLGGTMPDNERQTSGSPIMQDTICPSLEEVALKNIEWSNLDEAVPSLVRLIKGRCETGQSVQSTRLKRLVLDDSMGNRSEVDRLYAALMEDHDVERCRKEGFELIVKR